MVNTASAKVGITQDELVELHPRLFHMAAPGSWPSIQENGLLSTSALLDLFEVGGQRRGELEVQHRPELVTIAHPKRGEAVIRDQKPMDDAGLRRALQDGLTPKDWYALLNKRVFFWTERKRLDTLLSARAYRDTRQTVLTLDTAGLLARYATRVELSPINSGATKPMPTPRGRDTFLPLDHFPFEHWRKKRGSRRKAIVELTVLGGVPDVRDFVLRVEERGGGRPDQLVFERG